MTKQPVNHIFRLEVKTMLSEYQIIGYNPNAVYFTDWNCGYYLTLDHAVSDLIHLQESYPEESYTLIAH